MKWRGRRQSDNMGDQHRQSARPIGGMGDLLTKGGLGTIVIILIIS